MVWKAATDDPPVKIARETSIEGGRGVAASFESKVEGTLLLNVERLLRSLRYQSLPREWTDDTEDGT